MTDETPEQIAVRVLGEHADCRMNDDRDGFYGSAVDTAMDQWSCGTNVPFVPDLEDAERAHVAAVLTTELRAGGWLVEGETEVEWGVREANGGIWVAPYGGTEQGTRYAAEWPGRVAVHRQRTRYPDHVTEWQPVEDGA